MAEPIRLAAANDGEPQKLPRNIEAEAAFLGAILIDNRIIEDVPIKLRPDHFFEPLHGRIFDQILRLIDRNMLVTPVTLKPLFEADPAMIELGGPG
jgi:replicative DNA helicase